MAQILKAGARRMTSIRLRYSHIPFKKIVSKLFYVLHTSACGIFTIARRILTVIVGSDSFQSRETVTGAPQLLAVRSIDRYLPVRICVCLQQLLELLLRNQL